MQTLFSLIESPFHTDFSALHQKLGIAAERFDSARNLHRALQKQPPDFFVGEFIYRIKGVRVTLNFQSNDSRPE